MPGLSTCSHSSMHIVVGIWTWSFDDLEKQQNFFLPLEFGRSNNTDAHLNKIWMKMSSEKQLVLCSPEAVWEDSSCPDESDPSLLFSHNPNSN